MSDWKVEYYENERGNKPVETYIVNLPIKRQANIIRVIDLLEKLGVLLSKPYVKHIDDKIWELRPGNSRILYFLFTGRKIILLHGFSKKTKKTPKREIKIAKKRQKDYEQKNKL